MKPAARLLLLVAVVACLVGLWASPAAAHTGFESADPGDGALLDTPVDRVTLVFTGAAEPTGSGFQVLTADGELRQPTEQSSADGSKWVLEFDPPLTGGTVGLRWMVKAPDAHPIDGSFVFIVDVPAPGEAAPAGNETAVTDAVAAGATDSAPEVLGTSRLRAPEVADAVTLDEFLVSGEGATTGANRLATVGRIVGLGGAVLGVGAMVFAATVLRGTRGDIRSVLLWVRRSGLFLIGGALVELLAQVVIEAGGDLSQALWPATLGNVLWSHFGLAIGLRVLGGRALHSLREVHVARALHGSDPVVAIREMATVAARELVGGGAAVPPGPDPVRNSTPYVHPDDQAWVPAAGSVVPFLGVIAVVASYLFDGHTVSKGDRGLTGLLNIVHVTAGAVWVGGVAMLVAVLWRRHRDGRALRSLQLALRFSVVASIALVAVGVAGTALAVTILDTPVELWSTPWGRLLMAKTALVGVAGAMGGYNHKVLIPAMESGPADEALAHRFRRAVNVEIVLLVAAVVTTGALVGAAS